MISVSETEAEVALLAIGADRVAFVHLIFVLRRGFPR